MTESVRPARPHTGFTPDGRKLQVLTTYTRRGSRLTPRQQQAWDEREAQWLIPDDAVDRPGFDWADFFARSAPLAVEIGCGIGEATVELARRRPEANVVGFEVWRPGVAETFRRLEEAEVDNVRMISVDAVWCLEHLFAPGSISELWTFFPDPWPKKRHHRRRLINPEVAGFAARALAPGAEWRIATDWQDYAEQIDAVMSPRVEFEGGPTSRFDARPLTKFERRGLAAGHTISDFCYSRGTA